MPACLRKGAESSRIQELANNFDRKASKLTLNHRWPQTNTNTVGQNLQEKGEQMPQRSREVVVVVESVEKLRDDETTAMGWSCLGKPRNMLQIQLHMSLAYLIRETPSPARARDWILPRNLSSVRQQLSSPPQRQPYNSNVDDVHVDDVDKNVDLPISQPTCSKSLAKFLFEINWSWLGSWSEAFFFLAWFRFESRYEKERWSLSPSAACPAAFTKYLANKASIYKI